MYMISIEREM